MTAHPTPDALALIALGEDVEPEVVQHVGGCETCFHEIGALQQVVAIGRSLGPDDDLVEPHARVWERISTELQSSVGSPSGDVSVLERPQVGLGLAATAAVPAASSTTDELAARRRPAPRRRWATVAAAAAAALVVGLGGGYALKGLTGPGSETAAPTTTTQLNALPGWPGANGTATVEKGPQGQRTLVVSVTLPPTVDVADGTMEVWMSDTQARDMMAMGAMTSGDSTRFPIPASFDLATHPIIDVSLEPRNDPDPNHSATSVVRGRLNV
jgi:anti-sigma-K factor RskA